MMKKSARHYQRPARHLPTGPVMVERLSHEGRGIARTLAGKTVFIESAIPGDQVMYRTLRSKSRFEEAQVAEILQPSAQRVVPPCQFFVLCGGCTLQHMAVDAQLVHKQAMLEEQLAHFAGTQPTQGYMPALTGDTLGYRRKVGLSCSWVDQQLRIGFKEKHSHQVVDVNQCLVIDARINTELPELKKFARGLDAAPYLTHLDISAGDVQLALVVSQTVQMSVSDQSAWIAFCQARHWQLYFQINQSGTKKIWPVEESSFAGGQLTYALPAYALNLQFDPLDFIQVNRQINLGLIEQALNWLNPQITDSVLDLFCGLGNFTLPLARLAGQVVGVEGSTDLVVRAQHNAAHHQLNNVQFYAADLNQPVAADMVWSQHYDAVLLDPPRAGAENLITWIAKVAKPDRLVYVSCNPATLARDTGLLMQLGYVLQKVRLLDMFPHTAHAEAVAYFERTVILKTVPNTASHSNRSPYKTGLSKGSQH